MMGLLSPEQLQIRHFQNASFQNHINDIGLTSAALKSDILECSSSVLHVWIGFFYLKKIRAKNFFFTSF